MNKTSQFRLLGQRRFLPFFLTQALGAFNDNIFKNALLILIAFRSAAELGFNTGILVNLAAILFILPFFLFSSTFGQLADKYEKSRSIRVIKALEIGIMSLGVLALLLDSLPFLILVLFLLGLQSAAFGPIKHGILPQHLAREELTGGNGLVEMGTFLSILLGTLLGGVLISLPQNSIQYLSVAILAVAVCGYLTSRQIPLTPAVAPDLKINWNPLTQTIRTFRYIRTDKAVTESILGIAWFWFYGSVFLAQIPNYTQFSLGGTESVTTLILASFSVGIGTGSLICAKLSNGRVEPGIVPLGAFGLSLFTIHLYLGNPAADLTPVMGAREFLESWHNIRLLLDMVCIGISGGVFTVPLYAMVQNRTERGHLSRVVSGNNILNALFMVLSGLYAIVLIALDFTVPELFLITSLINVVIAIYIFRRVPEFIFRMIIWLSIHFLYRVRCTGMDKIPHDGPCVLVSNHVSFVDALVIAGCCRRPVRFVMYHRIFNAPFAGRIFRMANAIPIAPASEDRKLMKKAFEDIDQALARGQIVCLFPEGKLTSDGELDHFRKGIEHIVARRPVPVVPLALKGLWNSWFSRRKGRAMAGLPGYFRGTVELVAGAAVDPHDVSAGSLEVMVRELRGNRQ
ncbi:MAG: MFS transporter [Gammaproteobacteria bacterium]